MNLFKGILFLLIIAMNTSCDQPVKETPPKRMEISIDTFAMDCSIRAIKAIDDQTMYFAGSKGQFGFTKDGGKSWKIDSIKSKLQPKLEFRGIEKINDALFLLAVGSPALLYKSTDDGQSWKIVYQENHKAAFYDAIAFWDKTNGIAMGDPTDGCLSIITTNDGGETWSKIPCQNLPEAVEGEAAFAASNSNISIFENHVWIVSGGTKARVLHSADKGQTWTIANTPIVQGGKMTGIFSSDFYDSKNGIIMGGDWENKSQNTGNKAVTTDGGKTWSLIADGKTPNFRSCVQYIPSTNGKELIAVGIPGISYSKDGGASWKDLSEQSFYTIRFAADGKSAWLAGANKIGKMTW